MPESPLAKTSTVSLVLVSPSTVMALKDAFTAFFHSSESILDRVRRWTGADITVDQSRGKVVVSAQSIDAVREAVKTLLNQLG